LAQSTNKALGLNLTIEGDTTPPNRADRLAQPYYQEGAQFESPLRRIYRVESVADTTISGICGIIAFPAYPHPVQALMEATRGVTFPIVSSLQEPGEDRPI
jgi:hypothetical protein